MTPRSLIATATLLAAVVLAAAPVDAQDWDRGRSRPRAGDARVVGGSHGLPPGGDRPVRGGWDRPLRGGFLTVRPCDEPARFGPRWPNGACLSLYPHITVSREEVNGGLRLKVEPASAAVYVDDTYVGVVEAFDGDEERLVLTPGRHRIEVHAPDRQPLQFELYVQPGRTTAYHGALAAASSTPFE